MKKFSKNGLILIFMLAVSIPLFANGSGDTGGQKGQVADGTSPTVLKVTWWGGQSRHEDTQKLFDLYSTVNPDLSFEGAPSGWNGYFDKLATQAAAGALPDIVQMDYLYLATYAKNGSLEDLYSFTDDGTLKLSGIPEVIRNTGVIDGKLQAIVLSTSLVSIPYNENVLKEAGIDAPSSDWTWDDFIAICKKVKDKTGKYGFSMLPTIDTNFFNYYVRQNGESLYASDNKSLGYSDDAIMVNWLNMWKDLMEYGAIPTPDEFDSMKVAGTDTNPIASDKGAFIQEWSNYATKVDNNAIKLITPPMLKGGSKGLWMKPGMFFSVAANSDHKKESVEFINWFLNSEDANDITRTGRGTPVVDLTLAYLSGSGKMSVKDSEMLQYTKDAAELCGPSLPPDPQGSTELTTVYNDSVYSVLYNQATPAEAAASFRVKANEILSRNN